MEPTGTATGTGTGSIEFLKELDRRWTPQAGPQQEACLAKWCLELFFGGARGGGKSDFLLGDFLQDAQQWGPAWRGIIFRRSFPQLEELILRSKEIYPLAYPGAVFKEQSKTWHFPSGAWLRMRSLERSADADSYQGHQYSWEAWDELPTWPTPEPYLKLMGCLRSSTPGVPLRVRSTGNPGGIGHVWVKQRFVGSANAYAWVPQKDPETGDWRLFIPSNLSDNRIMTQADPKYVSRLGAVAGVSQALLKAWLEGDWDIVAGAYFDVFGPHLFRDPSSIRIENHWPVWIGGDWGFKHPSSVYWCTTDDSGNVGVFQEFCDSGLAPGDLGEQIGHRSQGYKIEEFHLSHDTFAQRTDADTIAAQIGDAITPFGIPYPMPSSKDRRGGAQLLYQLMKDQKVWISSACTELISILPSIIHDPDTPEDTLKMDGDDPYDGFRYAVYGRLRPRGKSVQEAVAAKVNHPDPTMRAIQARRAAETLKQFSPASSVPYFHRWRSS